MLEGKWSKECVRCKREFESNNMNGRNISERRTLAKILETESYPSYQKAKTLTQTDGSISLNDFPISFLDIRFGNLCNLKCVTCGPLDSSMWHDDYISVSGKEFSTSIDKNIKLVCNTNDKLKTKKNIFEWNDNPHFWLQIEKHVQQLRKIYIAGGEPFLMKTHYDFLKKLIEKGISKKVIVQYNSNITALPKFLWNTWKNFKRVDLGVSVDGFGHVNDFIRFPSKWKQIEKNLLLLDKTKSNFSISISSVISVLNIWHLPEFIGYIIEKNYKRINASGIGKNAPLLHPISCHTPHHLNINILGREFKEVLRKRFKYYKEKFFNLDWQKTHGESNGEVSWKDKISRACQILDDYMEFMYVNQYNEEELIQHRKTFIYFMDRLDKLRGTCWKKVLPELYKNTLNWRKLNYTDSV